MIVEERRIGGCRIYFTPEGGAEFEFSEAQEVNFKIEAESKEAYDRSSSTKKEVGEAVTGIKSTLDFVGQKFTKEAVSMAMLGTATTETFAVGDTLPDGTVATAETTLDVTEGGTKPLIKGSFRIVGDKDGDEYPVLKIGKASVKPTGDIKYISDEFGKLNFSGKVLLDENGKYFKEYIMKV